MTASYATRAACETIPVSLALGCHNLQAVALLVLCGRGIPGPFPARAREVELGADALPGLADRQPLE